MNEELSSLYTPTIEEIEAAQKVYEAKYPHDIPYRAVLELVGLAWQGKTSVSEADAVWILLQDWNKSYYQYRPYLKQNLAHHLSGIQRLIDEHRHILTSLRERSVESLVNADEAIVTILFTGFVEILGPVGTAKCLHSLAPRFFPPWDTKIAAAYGYPIGESSKHAWRYWHFMRCIQRQYQNIGGDQAIGRNLIKALDEYNFCKYTSDWI